MFCTNCGEKNDDGVKFCMKCGTAIPQAGQTPVVRNNVNNVAVGNHEKLDVGSRSMEDIGRIPNKTVPIQSPASVQANTGTNKLILVAAIIAIGLPLIAVVVAHVFFFRDLTRFNQNPGERVPIETNRGEIFYIYIDKPDYVEFCLPFIGLLASAAIPVALSFSGWKKNNRKMVLIAGIIYPFCPLWGGIPSAIMCFIVFRKMKKPA